MIMVMIIIMMMIMIMILIIVADNLILNSCNSRTLFPRNAHGSIAGFQRQSISNLGLAVIGQRLGLIFSNEDLTLG